MAHDAVATWSIGGVEIDKCAWVLGLHHQSDAHSLQETTEVHPVLATDVLLQVLQNDPYVQQNRVHLWRTALRLAHPLIDCSG